MECDGKIIAYSGDTEWNDTLLEAASRADIFISEDYFYERKIKGHVDDVTLMSHYRLTEAKRLILTHMSSNMLTMRDCVSGEYAEDGEVYFI